MDQGAGAHCDAAQTEGVVPPPGLVGGDAAALSSPPQPLNNSTMHSAPVPSMDRPTF